MATDAKQLILGWCSVDDDLQLAGERTEPDTEFVLALTSGDTELTVSLPNGRDRVILSQGVDLGSGAAAVEGDLPFLEEQRPGPVRVSLSGDEVTISTWIVLDGLTKHSLLTAVADLARTRRAVLRLVAAPAQAGVAGAAAAATGDWPAPSVTAGEWPVETPAASASQPEPEPEEAAPAAAAASAAAAWEPAASEPAASEAGYQAQGYPQPGYEQASPTPAYQPSPAYEPSPTGYAAASPTPASGGGAGYAASPTPAGGAGAGYAQPSPTPAGGAGAGYAQPSPTPAGGAGAGYAQPSPSPTPFATPSPAPAPTPVPAQAAWTPGHKVPPQGMQAWAAPDPNGAVVATLGGHLPVQVTEMRGAWAHIVCSNGWTGWVDGRLLVAGP